MPSITFLPQPLLASEKLPLTVISLEQWVVINVIGDERIRYLQSQLTLDVNCLRLNQHRYAAHCNPYGKTWSNLCLFHRGNKITYIVRRSLYKQQLNELKKYAMFSKIMLVVDDQAILLGIAGIQAKNALDDFFYTLPNILSPVIQQEHSTLLWFERPKERFILVTTIEKADIFMKYIKDKAHFNNSLQWLALDIEAGIPIIENHTTGKFIPQALNLQALNAISFKKGCYIGQEVVARATFRNSNQRALYWLSGVSSKILTPNDTLEIKIGNYWRRSGIILAVCQLENNIIWIQAILNKNLKNTTLLRAYNDEKSQFKINQISYKI
ncbi:tRNA-modifying protein YgfZ [Candidatus Erwinia haradaeae]|uniref:tRNA-modifying protein YgfZ n=1 Tax=Candidatus Erwinia haradaeae TaxID=1922217 RepID=A0A451DN97_9GAMM|nr:tRNA-modifying protein YgfZ [Candidatus Erwinia haradaeae]VFP88245.1 tRNA-modifying protein YgfZ [Candidatus Erwinia haradaeae]